MLLITEPLRALLEISTLPATWGLIKKFNTKSHMVNDELIVTLPGFFGGDMTMACVRKYLSSIGHTCYGWEQGRNWGFHDHVEDSFETYLEQLVEQHGKPARLIGHSLGGIYSREMAKRRPDLVCQVITLGTPFNHPEQDDVVASWIRVIYEVINGELSGNEKEIVDQIRMPPACPTHCFYSKGDGIVKYNICLQDDPPHNVENVEVFGSHAGMGHNPLILYLIGNRIQKHSK